MEGLLSTRPIPSSYKNYTAPYFVWCFIDSTLASDDDRVISEGKLSAPDLKEPLPPPPKKTNQAPPPLATLYPMSVLPPLVYTIPTPTCFHYTMLLVIIKFVLQINSFPGNNATSTHINSWILTLTTKHLNLNFVWQLSAHCSLYVLSEEWSRAEL